MIQSYPDEGLPEQLERILSPGVKLHLYSNNVTVTSLVVLADLIEGSWTGYAAISVALSDFTTIGVNAHHGYAIAGPVSFHNSSGSAVTAYGYYFTDTGDTVLLAMAQFDSPPVSIPAGGDLQVVPRWGDFSG